VKIVHDTTAEHAAAEDLRRKALVDPLTELPNRRTFYDHVQRAISFFKRRSANSFAVLFVDLDHFKAVNDEFGHTLADNVLRTIARRLESCVRSGDIVARVGGDEFSILLNGLGGQLDADDAAQRILHVMQQAISTDVGDVFAAVSVGIAIGTAKYERPEEVMQDADAAMYVAKTQGRARAVVFDDSMATVARDNLVLTTALRHAIERNELRLAYQPVLRLCDMKPVGFEALVRWRHPRRGLLVPGEFMPQAEESNLVFAVDRWVLTQVCGQIVNWRTRGIITPGFQISINVSSKEFTRDEFADEVRAILRHQDVDPTTLRFEITENTLFERSLRAYANLAAVRAIGIKVDVDDFGTGYASLRSLNDISVDGLKIDWSFITSRHGQHGWEIAESVISLAHKLGLIAIAEGIESATQFERLLALGCDFGQGYLFAPALGPVAAAAFARDGFSLHSTTPL
jgi:diguanylate cyclase (GGDEF)-like protein